VALAVRRPYHLDTEDAMSEDLSKLLAEALRLPEEARAALAGHLLDSLEHDVPEDVESEWSREIAGRLAELDSGAVRPVPWHEARRAIVGSEDDPTQS
jgi:putative addiction module component (TIGR02574 family)